MSAFPSLLLPTPAIAGVGQRALDDFWTKDRWLWLRRRSTGEEYNIPFLVAGQMDWGNYVRLCYLLRDVRDGGYTVQMDTGLFNLLYGIQEWSRLLGRNHPIVINSGVRTQRHNDALEGAAKNSMHLVGKAADITLQGTSLRDLGSMAKFYGAGGVGEYSSFVHVDVGRVRSWRSR